MSGFVIQTRTHFGLHFISLGGYDLNRRWTFLLSYQLMKDHNSLMVLRLISSTRPGKRPF